MRVEERKGQPQTQHKSLFQKEGVHYIFARVKSARYAHVSFFKFLSWRSGIMTPNINVYSKLCLTHTYTRDKR